jgi:hypothetical protein
MWRKIPAFAKKTEKIYEEGQNIRSPTETQTVGSLMQVRSEIARASFLGLAA